MWGGKGQVEVKRRKQRGGVRLNAGDIARRLTSEPFTHVIVEKDGKEVLKAKPDELDRQIETPFTMYVYDDTHLMVRYVVDWEIE